MVEYLRADDDGVSRFAREKFTDDRFGVAVPIGVGGIEEVYPGVISNVHGRQYVCLGLFAPETGTELPRAETDGRDLQPRSAENNAIIHFALLSAVCWLWIAAAAIIAVRFQLAIG